MKPLYKTLMIILVVAVCFVFAYIKDASANVYGRLGGKLQGKPWVMKSVTLKNARIDGLDLVILELNDREVAEAQLCDENLDTNTLVARIPLTIENGLKIAMVESADFRMNGENDVNTLNVFPNLELNEAELNSASKFVSGKIELISKKEKIEIAGDFKARVCN